MRTGLISAGSVLGLLVVTAFAFAAAVSAAPDRAGPPAPPLTAAAAIVLDADSGAVLFAKNAQERLPPASLTKMATAMIALERAQPDLPIVATERSLTEPSTIGMEPGDQLPLREAIYGLLLNSGNDAALAIGETVGEGSIDRFVGWMNLLAGALGLRDTHFANPHGLDVGEHYSSAFDLAILGRTLLLNPLLRSVVGERRHDFVGPPLWAFRTLNPLLGNYLGANGIKTGYETRAGRCLAASATRDGRTVIAVVLNSPRYAAESAALLDFGFAELARRAASAPAAQPPPAASRLARLMSFAAGTGSNGPARALLRGMLRPDAESFERDPAFTAAPDSVYDRLVAAGRS